MQLYLIFNSRNFLHNSKLKNQIVAFGTLIKRRRHLRHHENKLKYRPQIKKHLCPICGQGFAATTALTAHLMRHNNLRPFKCTESECDKTFVTKGELEGHLRLVHMC